jgi:hypothetical protein
MEYMSALQPGDKLTLAIQKMKPTWLSEQTAGAGAQSQPSAAPAAPAASPEPAPSMLGPSREALMSAMGRFNPGQ